MHTHTRARGKTRPSLFLLALVKDADSSRGSDNSRRPIKVARYRMRARDSSIVKERVRRRASLSRAVS